MATPKFIEITEDPWLNNTDEFVLFLICGRSQGVALYFTSPGGTDYYWQIGEFLTSSTAYPYSFQTSGKIVPVLPPGFIAYGHIAFIGIQGSLEDLRGYI